MTSVLDALREEYETSRRDVLGLVGFSALGLFAGRGTAAVQQASEADPTGVCVIQGPDAARPEPPGSGAAVLYLAQDTGARYLAVDGGDWQLLHITSDELRLRDPDDDTAPAVGLINDDGTLYEVTYE